MSQGRLLTALNLNFSRSFSSLPTLLPPIGLLNFSKIKNNRFPHFWWICVLSKKVMSALNKFKWTKIFLFILFLVDDYDLRHAFFICNDNYVWELRAEYGSDKQQKATGKCTLWYRISSPFRLWLAQSPCDVQLPIFYVAKMTRRQFFAIQHLRLILIIKVLFE